MKRLALIVILGLIMVYSSGCAIKVYQGPTSGRSSEYQICVSKAADEAFKEISFEALKDKKVFVEVNGLAAKAHESSAEESFIKSGVYQKLFEAGSKPVEARNEADYRVSVRLRVAGVDIVTRHLPLIYYRTALRGTVNARVVIFDQKANSIDAAFDVGSVVYYSEIYVFYLLGPYRSLYVPGEQYVFEKAVLNKGRDVSPVDE